MSFFIYLPSRKWGHKAGANDAFGGADHVGSSSRHSKDILVAKLKMMMQNQMIDYEIGHKMAGFGNIPGIYWNLNNWNFFNLECQVT